MYITKQKYKSVAKKNQQGFVLILALVLLAVMTLIGVSSMNGANMELRAAANARQHQLAFNAGQSVLEYTLSTGAQTTVGVPISYQTTAAALQPVNHPSNNNAQATIRYVGCSVAPGSSWENGKSFSYSFYSVASDSSSSASSTASSQLNQGVRFIAAACGG